MNERIPRLFLLLLFLVVPSLRAQKFPLTSTTGLTGHGAELSAATFQGRKAVKLVESRQTTDDSIAVVDGVELRDGTIDVDLAGAPTAGATEGARGFIGVAFRVRGEGEPRKFEVVYLRPTNGRANDQLRRNHSTQYCSPPEWPWHRLRQESPGVYESYVDLQPATWTHVRIVVRGRDASLFVNRAEQPCLVVHDLKLGTAGGGVALWIGPEAVGYFSKLVIRKEN
jgi:hypothetical protein